MDVDWGLVVKLALPAKVGFFQSFLNEYNNLQGDMYLYILFSAM
jgi:hypothetical protein